MCQNVKIDFFHLFSKSLKIECKNYPPYSKSEVCIYQITLDYQMSITWDDLDAKRFLVTFVQVVENWN